MTATPVKLADDAVTLALALGPDGTFVANWTAPSYSSLYALSGTAQEDGTITINGASNAFDSGAQGGVAIDATGVLFEAHQTNNVFTKTIWYHVGTAQGGTATFGKSATAQTSTNDTITGGNVTVAAVSPGRFLAGFNVNSAARAFQYSMVKVAGHSAVWGPTKGASGTFDLNGQMLMSPQLAVSGKYVIISSADGMAIAILDGDELVWQGGAAVDGDIWSPQSSIACAFGLDLTVHSFVEKSSTIFYSKGQLDPNKLQISWSVRNTPVCKGDSVAAACNGKTLLYAFTNDRTAYLSTWAL